MSQMPPPQSPSVPLPPPRSARSVPEPGSLVIGVAAALGLTLLHVVLSVIPGIAGWAFSNPGLQLLILIVETAVLAGVLGAIGLTRQRRLVAAGLAVGAGLLEAIAFGMHVVMSHGSSPLPAEVMTVLTSFAAPFVVIAAWGAARRRHRGWLIGLGLSVIVVVLMRLLHGFVLVQLYNRVDLSNEGAYLALVFGVAGVMYCLVIALGCLVCWAFDRPFGRSASL